MDEMKKLPLGLAFLTEDNSYRDFACEYWNAYLDSGGRIAYPKKVWEVCAQFGVDSFAAVPILEEVVEASYGSCSRCGEALRVRSRSQLAELVRLGDAVVCSECLEEGHLLEEERRRTQAALEETRNRSLIGEQFGKPLDAVELSSITLRDAVFLLTAFRASTSEDLNAIIPLGEHFNDLAPTRSYATEILQHLYARKVIAPSPESGIEAFAFEDQSVKLMPNRIFWRIAQLRGTASSLVEVVEGVLNDNGLPDHWRNEAQALWEEIALEECLQYLLLQFHRHKMEFAPGEKTCLLFRAALTTFSVSQMYSLIRRAVKDAAAWYQEGKVIKLRAANSVVGRIQHSVDRARADKWNVPGYRRDYECPQSVMSQVLFGAVLKIGDGFDKLPCLDEQVAK